MRTFVFFVIASIIPGIFPCFGDSSVARQWNEICLDAIRQDFPAPTVHSRNLYHLSAAMYDAWAAYDPITVGVFHNESLITTGTLDADRDEAVSYAAYRILRSRYSIAQNAAASLQTFDALMTQLGYDPSYTTRGANTPAALGNRVAATIIANLASDGANQANLYVDPTGYETVNPPLNIDKRGTQLFDPNRWQPIEFDMATTVVQTFVSPHWEGVQPFALTRGSSADIYNDPGPPPYLGGTGDQAFKNNNVDVIRLSRYLDPSNGLRINLSPSARGNNPLGTDAGAGHVLNPFTLQHYPANIVNHADYGRVSAEFWADGPESETPPGHWNVLANEASDHPLLTKRIGGTGPLASDLEWDVKLYLSLNAALHDAAIAAWNTKVAYDYVRPISSIRYLGGKGQSSNPALPSYDPEGLPLVPALIELITPATAATGQRHAHLASAIGQIAIYAWVGEPDNPATEYGGSDWILPGDWLPYQRDSFVTPAFAGYVSGHSTFSRAAAEILTAFTGSPYFPGGIASHTQPAGSLAFEFGPSEPVTLQWATYYDAADEAGLSRLYGGIHVAPDDYAGRLMGAEIGQNAAAKAFGLFDGSALSGSAIRITGIKTDAVTIRCPTIPGYFYKFQASSDVGWSQPQDVSLFQAATQFELENRLMVSPTSDLHFFRAVRVAP